MRPRRIEIHIDWQGTREPDAQAAQERPARWKIFFRQLKGKQDSQEAVDSGADYHREDVWRRKPIRGNVSAEEMIDFDGAVGRQQERNPQHRRPNREMIIKVAIEGELLG